MSLKAFVLNFDAPRKPLAIGRVLQVRSDESKIHKGPLPDDLAMASQLEDPDHWRKRAKEARDIADAIADPQSKGEMLKIAESYEKLAGRATSRRAAKKPLQSK